MSLGIRAYSRRFLRYVIVLCWDVGGSITYVFGTIREFFKLYNMCQMNQKHFSSGVRAVNESIAHETGTVLRSICRPIQDLTRKIATTSHLS